MRWSIRLARNPQAGIAGLHPPELARRVVGGDDRSGRESEDGDARHRGHRLVQMEHVEALLLEHPLDPEDRAWAENDVRERPVRRHDHRATDRDHVRRRITVTADTGMEDTRELTRRVITHHQPYLVPTRLERFGLELGVLDDGAPERPRERHHDADLHAVSLEDAGSL